MLQNSAVDTQIGQPCGFKPPLSHIRECAAEGAAEIDSDSFTDLRPVVSLLYGSGCPVACPSKLERGECHLGKTAGLWSISVLVLVTGPSTGTMNSQPC